MKMRTIAETRWGTRPTFVPRCLCFLAVLLCINDRASSLKEPEDAGGRPEARAPNVVFQYRNRKYTFADITGTRYADALEYCREALKLYKGGRLRPATHIWPFYGKLPDSPSEAFPAYCRIYVNSIARLYVASFVFDRIMQEHPEASCFFREDELDGYCRSYANLLDKWEAFFLKVYRENWSAERYARYRGFVLTDFTRSYFEQRKADLPICYLEYKVFPPLIDGRPAPWVKPRTKALLVFYQVAGIIRKNMDYWLSNWQKYEKEKELQDSLRWDILLLVNVPPEQKALRSIKRQLNEIVDDRGRVALRGLNRLNHIWRLLGTGMTVHYFAEMNYLSCMREFGVDMTKAGVRTFVRVPFSKRIGTKFRGLKEGRAVYMYVLSRRRKKMAGPRRSDSKLTYFGIPFWLFIYARPRIVRPYVEEVLKEMQFFPPYRKPSVEDMVREVGRDQLERGVCGEPIIPRLAEYPTKREKKEK